MIRVCVAGVAAVMVQVAYAGSLFAQAPAQAPAQKIEPPPMTAVLTGKNFTPPVRGEALVEYTAPATKRDKDTVVTRITVRNASPAPIARLAIEETWYDKANAVLTAGKGSLSGVLQPGEIQTVVIETPFKAGMNANNFTFSHSNGTVKPTRVPKLDVPKETPAPAGAPPK